LITCVCVDTHLHLRRLCFEVNTELSYDCGREILLI